MASVSCVLGLGANLGARERALAAAVAALGQGGVSGLRQSSLFLTEPVGGPPQDWYLNQVVAGETALGPRALLELCLAVERGLGRQRSVKDAPRTIDIDVLLYGDLVDDDPALTLPHPRLHQRRFVLVPLAEIAPERIHPRLGVPVRELLRRCQDPARVLPHAAAAAR